MSHIFLLFLEHTNVEKFFLYSILLVFLLCGCNRYRQGQQIDYDPGEVPLMHRITSSAIVLDIENAKLTDYDALVEELIYIPLGREKGMLGSIKNIIYYNDRFYIQDEGQDQVFIFNRTGENIRKISAKGRGPKEYLGIGNIDIDAERDALIIRDVLSGRSLYYDLDGNYMYSYDTPFQSDGMLWLSDSTLLYLCATHQNGYTQELARYGLLATSGDSLVAKEFKYLPSQTGYYSARNNLRRGYDKVYYRPLFSDSIYAINSDLTYSLAYYARFKDSAWKKYNKSDKFVSMHDKGHGEYLFPWFYETQDFFIGNTKVTGNKTMDHVIYDKQKGVTYISQMKEYDSIKELNRFYGYDCFGVGNGYFIFACDAIIFEERTGINKRLKDSTLTITDPNLEKIIKNLNVNDNPILILTKFKSI